jgi:hypothetical protein
MTGLLLAIDDPSLASLDRQRLAGRMLFIEPGIMRAR